MKSVLIDKKHLRRDLQIQQHPLWQRARPEVEQFIGDLRSAKTPEAHFNLHRDLLSNFWAVQQLGKSARQQHEETRALISVAAQARDEPRVRSRSQLMKTISEAIDTTSALLSVLRIVADALVWRLLGYHRGVITALSDGTRVGRLSDGVGLQTEIDEISWLWEEHAIVAVHADITNCVRAGDLLSIEQWTPRQVRLTESKASGLGARGVRQTARLEQLSALINDGYHATADRGQPLTLVVCPTPFQTHLPRINELLQTAKSDSYAVGELEEGIFVETYDYSDPGRMAGTDLTDFAAVNEGAIAERGWVAGDTLHRSVEFRRLCDRQETSGMQLPLALLPFSAQDTTGLLMGPLNYAMSINAEILERRLSGDGLSVTIARPPEAQHWFLRASRGPHTITMPAAAREHLMVEALTVDSLRNRITWLLEDTARRGERRTSALIGFAEDAATWERALA